MLIVRRRAGESILVGENVEIQILEVGPLRVTLGIVAPREVSVMRSEVKLTRDQNRAAAELTSTAPLAQLASALQQRGR
ncbi:MAG: carbon storage regulator [Acidobacteria bacterium]|nr:carbon storage regulator [Acidobacteriota bacterium]